MIGHFGIWFQSILEIPLFHVQESNSIQKKEQIPIPSPTEKGTENGTNFRKGLSFWNNTILHSM